MADEELELDVNQPKGNKMTNILLIVLILLVLAIGGAGAWFFFLKGDSAAEPGSESATEEVKAPLHYFNLLPEFVVNFGPGSKVRYLQVDLQVATRDEKALAEMTTYMPVIRNDILVLLSGQSFDDLKSRAGKEALQKKILDKMNMIMTSVEGEAHGDEQKNEAAAENTDATEADKPETPEASVVQGPIENVYFTSFIMQ